MARSSWLLVAWILMGVSLAEQARADNQPFPPGEAAKRMTLPEGFQATLFAGEPDLVQPIAFTFDDRGRLWVAECFSYPKWQTDGRPGKDRILIFEDRDGDGHFDSCKVFYDKIANISGLQVGFGGVWVCATPNLLFIPDRDGNDVPDGPPQIVLDGWDLKAQHNVFNGLTWGPNGWLYGCNGILSNSRVGKPGTPDAQRVALNCGVWRYHPVRQQFEVVASGTTNPWGLDFDDYGQMFITNCVIQHAWHVVPGAHFQRMFGNDLNPFVFDLMASGADHIHWAGGPWQSSRGGQGKHSETGGGHAHSGAMIYLGDNWPDRYRNGLFMCNIHGNRINHDTLDRQGSGYVLHHAHDFLFANDPWFRGVALHQGPDGGVYVADWCDTGECHNYIEVDRTNGRIFKVTYGQPKPWHGDLARLSDAELVQLQLHKNDWHVRHARRLLQERAAAGKLMPDTHAALRQILLQNPDVTRKLRALWALHVTGGLDEPLSLQLLSHQEDRIRAWVVQLGVETGTASPELRERFAGLAAKEPAASVRLALASALQRLPLAERWPIAEPLLGHAEDAGDRYLPLMLWYAVEPLVPAEPARSMSLLAHCRVPLVREYLTRRFTTLADVAGLAPVLRTLASAGDTLSQRDILRGLAAAFQGRRQVPMPPGWKVVAAQLAQSSSAEVREEALLLSVRFDDAPALEELRRVIVDRSSPLPVRNRALEALVFKRPAGTPRFLQQLLRDPSLRGPAIRGLAAFEDPATPSLLLDAYSQLSEEEKSDVIQTLTARPASARALLDAIAAGRVPRRDLSAYAIRQLMDLRQPAITERVAKIWGTIRPASAEKQALMAKYKQLLTVDYLKTADLGRGRQLFAKTCASCHRLFDAGSDVGPELTGSQRQNLDYVLENILDPSAIVAKEYQVTILETKDGRVLTGIIKQETDRSLTVRTQNDTIIVPRNEIESRTQSPLSMMPEGLLTPLKDEEVRDLIGYLAAPHQVGLPDSPGEKHRP